MKNNSTIKERERKENENLCTECDFHRILQKLFVKYKNEKTKQTKKTESVE